MENSLIPALKDTIFSPTFELASEYAEIGIDAILDSETLKAIPIVNTISSVCRIGYNVHERSLLRHTLYFIDGFNAGVISQEALEKYRKKLDEDPHKAEKELGRVIIILGKHIEEIQSKILGRFYCAYVKGAISWGKFSELSEANRRMFVTDYVVLLRAFEGLEIAEEKSYQIDRLISLGMVQERSRHEGMTWGRISGKDKSIDVIITPFGKTFCQLMPRI